MKIAIASDGPMVTEHFGHCEGFAIYETNGTDATMKGFLQNPGHRPGFLPVYLNEQGVNVIISGGMGGGAIDIFNEKGIEVITGATGSADSAAQAYAQGKLQSTGSVCHQHMHADECGHH